MLHYRVGTHGTFLETMIRRLTNPVDGPATGYSLHKLTTRETDDPAIAMLDVWATVGDVLTFYQERIANEGFLRTAIERRSILELGRLVGYRLKPGVSSSVYLAYTVEDTTHTTIPAGSKSQSIPGAGEQAETFETSEDFEARGEWNALLPRLSEPLVITLDNVLTIGTVWIKGTSKRIDPGDPLLFVFTAQERQVYAIRRVLSTKLDTEKDRTEIALEPLRLYYLELYDLVRHFKPAVTPTPTPKSKKKKAAMINQPPSIDPITLLRDQILLGATRDDLQIFVRFFEKDPDTKVIADQIQIEETADVLTPNDGVTILASSIVKNLAARPGLAPASQWQFGRTLAGTLQESSDYLPRLVSSFLPRTETALYASLSQITTAHQRTEVQFHSLHVLHRRASVFGYNAPTVVFEEPPTKGDDPVPLLKPRKIPEDDAVLYLDSPVETLARGTYVVARRVVDLDLPNRLAVVAKAREVETLARSAYTISAKTTRLTLDENWANFKNLPADVDDMIDNLKIIRTASVFTESEELELVQRPITRHVGAKLDDDTADTSDESATRIALDKVIEGLAPGRWVIVNGERFPAGATTGIITSELAMIADVEFWPAPAGGTSYSVLVLAPEGLKYRYQRSTVKVYGNVVKATHGQTFNEILGAGDAAKSLQTFNLHQKPLTFVSAPTPAGVVSTLAVRVTDVLWHESDSFFGTAPTDRIFVTKTADDGTVSVIFGNGVEGSRVPSGPDNVRAVYRAGIGKPGNVRARQISTAISRPLGVKDVINPLAASGGANPESRDDARRNIPVSLQAMGRVVSVQDFADFARTFAGISKATAVALTDGRRRVVHLTIGGTEDIEIDVNSDLYQNLLEALRKYGDPYQPFYVSPREKLVLAGSAKVRVDRDYLWVNVAPKIRATLLDVFSFDRRDFGQVLFPAEVTAAIQGVEGVEYVDLDLLGPIAQEQVIDLTEQGSGFKVPKITGIDAIVPKAGRLTADGRDFLGAQLAYLPPALADLFILTEIADEP
jgi:predicted phage baseplate assembly protein